MCATGCSLTTMPQALTLVLERGRVGETYNIGGKAERRNIDVVNAICDAMDQLAPQPEGRIASRAHHLRAPIAPATISATRSILASSTPSSAGRRSTPSKPASTRP